MIWKDGRRYQGRWQDGQRTGRGTLTYAPGGRHQSYEGDFVNGRRQGEGLLTWRDGRRQEGR